MERSLSSTQIEEMERGAETYIYIDEPALSPGTLVERIVRLLGKTPPLWHIPLSIATPIATVSDVAAECTGIDFTGVKLPSVSRLRLVSLRSFTDVNSFHSFSITAARIRDV